MKTKKTQTQSQEIPKSNPENNQGLQPNLKSTRSQEWNQNQSKWDKNRDLSREPRRGGGWVIIWKKDRV